MKEALETILHTALAATQESEKRIALYIGGIKVDFQDYLIDQLGIKLADAADPDWSPDGTKLLFVSLGEVSSEKTIHDIYLYDFLKSDIH